MRKLGDGPISWSSVLFIAAMKALPDVFFFVWMLYARVSWALYFVSFQEGASTCIKPITSCSVFNLPKPHLT